MRVALSPFVAADLALLARWLAEPHVARWWPREDASVESVTAEYGPCLDGTDPTELLVVTADGRPVGMLQRYRLDDYAEWGNALSFLGDLADAAGIDYLVGEPDAVGRGVGSAAVAAGAASCFARWPGAGRVVVSVQQANTASWRALERAGFVRVWAGLLGNGDPSDAGPAYVYELLRG